MTTHTTLRNKRDAAEARKILKRKDAFLSPEKSEQFLRRIVGVKHDN